MNKAVFLDRDGTINVDKHYLYKIEEFEFLPGVVECLRRLHEAGFLLVIITNQSGIARGYYTEEDYLKLNRWMIKTLLEKNVPIDASYYCPHLPDADVERYRMVCECRKPKLGLFQKAVRELDICLSESFAIGDRLRDLSICNNGAPGSYCRGFLVEKTECQQIIDNVKTGRYGNRIFYENTLEDAGCRILETCTKKLLEKSV